MMTRRKWSSHLDGDTKKDTDAVASRHGIRLAPHEDGHTLGTSKDRKPGARLNIERCPNSQEKRPPSILVAEEHHEQTPSGRVKREHPP